MTRAWIFGKGKGTMGKRPAEELCLLFGFVKKDALDY